MRTLVRVEHANCTYCLNDALAALEARPLVEAVRASTTEGCWEIEHDHDDPAAIVEQLTATLHGWEVAGNGEIVEVSSTAVVAEVCAAHHHEPDDRPGQV